MSVTDMSTQLPGLLPLDIRLDSKENNTSHYSLSPKVTPNCCPPRTTFHHRRSDTIQSVQSTLVSTQQFKYDSELNSPHLSPKMGTKRIGKNCCVDFQGGNWDWRADGDHFSGYLGRRANRTALTILQKKWKRQGIGGCRRSPLGGAFGALLFSVACSWQQWLWCAAFVDWSVLHVVLRVVICFAKEQSDIQINP